MSNRGSLKLVLSPRARADISSILAYTSSKWGQRQKEKYRSQLFAGLQRLRDFPGLGQPYSEFEVDARSFPIREHVIIYSVEGQELRIWRVFHPREDREYWLND